MSDDLHARLVAEVTRRLEVARAALAVWPERGFYAPNMFHETQINTHDPADAIRRYEAALRVLGRHAPRFSEGGSAYCGWCEQGILSPCPDVVDLAASLDIEVTE